MNGFLTELLHVTLNLNLDGILLFHFLLVTYFIGVIISVRRPVGVAFAWIFIVMTFPVLGICLYVLIGDRPVGRKLTRKITRMNREYSKITEEMRTKYAVDKQLLPLRPVYLVS
jgi:cardiolipin synthase